MSEQRVLSKWGNSLGLRIPAWAAKEVGLREGDKVDVQYKDGRIYIRPLPNPKRDT
jgi:AbrB family looped-hinge helix DNA binding protein